MRWGTTRGEVRRGTSEDSETQKGYTKGKTTQGELIRRLTVDFD